MQQIPSKNSDIKPTIIPEKGNVFVGGDYSAQEPKTLGHLSQDPVLLQNFREHRDIYSTLVSTAYGMSYDECTKEAAERAEKEWEDGGKVGPKPINYRNQGKILQLALSYGLGPKSLAEILKITLDEARDLMNGFKENLSSVFAYEKALHDSCRINGYVETIMGRKRRFPNFTLPEVMVVSNGFTQVSNQLENDLIRQVTRLGKFDEWRQRQALIKTLEAQHNVTIIDNKIRRGEDTTQIMNSVIQGRELPLHILPTLSVGVTC